MNSFGNLEGLIPLAGGIYGLCAALGFVQISRNPESSRAWRERYGRTMCVLAPVVMAFGLARLVGWL